MECHNWDEMVMSFDDYCFFHSQSWARVLFSAYGYKPCYFTLWKKDKLYGVIPMAEIASAVSGKRGNCLPFTDHCRPLIMDAEDFQIILRNIIETGQQRKWRRVEFRGGQKYMPSAPKTATYNLHLLKLISDEEALLKTFRNSTKRNIKNALQKEITIDISTDMSSVKEFYRLNCITRRHHGVPPQPFYFFQSIQNHVLSKDQGMIVLARYNREPIAGALFFHFGRKAMYKYGASRRDFLGIRPNNLVMWEAIKWYCKNGYAEFDMGRSEIGNKGLNQFKNGWRATVEDLFYYTFDITQMKFSRQKEKMTTNINRIFQKMPLPVLRIIGQLAYRHMG